MIERVPYAACPLCCDAAIADYRTADCTGHPLYQPALPPKMRWKQCRSCEHIFAEGYFTEEARRLIFGTVNEGQKVGYQVEEQRDVSARMIDKILPYTAGGRWLDIGFGNGSLLFTAQEYGFVPVGVDLREENVRVMSALGIEAHCKPLSEVALPETCAVVSMADVLEHMPFPADGLRAAHCLLVDDGVLLVSMPNTESIVWRVLDKNGVNPYWGEIEHCHNFSRTRLYALLRETGFEPVRYGVSERYRACMEVVARRC